MAYVYAAALDLQQPERIGLLKVLIGTINVTSYHATNVEITEITGAFRGPFRVVFGTSDLGREFEWTGTSIKSWEGASGAHAESTDDEDSGLAEFIAIGVG